MPTESERFSANAGGRSVGGGNRLLRQPIVDAIGERHRMGKKACGDERAAQSVEALFGQDRVGAPDALRPVAAQGASQYRMI